MARLKQLLLFFISGCIFSCSSNEAETLVSEINQKEIYGIINDYWNSDEKKIKFAQIGTDGAVEVPYLFKYVQQKGESRGLAINKEYNKRKDFIDCLSLKKIIDVNKIDDKKESIFDTKIYSIELSQSGKNHLISNATDFFILKSFDYELQIENIIQVQDTIKADCKIINLVKTSFYECIEESFRKIPESKVGDSYKFTLLQTGNERWGILSAKLM